MRTTSAADPISDSSRTTRREVLKRWVGGSLTASVAACRQEEGRFPSHPIRLVVPYSIGSGTDRQVRAIEPYLRDPLGVPVIVENEPGADGRTALSRFARASPDCYQLAFYGVPSTILGELLYDVPYRIRDFSHIFGWIREHQVLLVRTGRWNDLAGLQSEGRRRRLAAGVPYLTSATRLVGLYLAKETGMNCGWVPFEGSNGVIAAVLGGHVDFGIVSPASALPLVEAGDVTPLILFAGERDHSIPDAPTPAELGLQLPNLPTIRGVVAPHGAAPEPLRVLEQAFAQAIRDPAFLEQAKARSESIFPMPADEFRQQVESYYEVIEPFREILLEGVRE